MADPKLIDSFVNNEPPREIPGGPRRPSKTVDLGQYDLIRRRQRLNSLLLQRSCGVDEPAAQVFEPEDAGVLIQIARERDPNGHPAIRKHAINALGQFRSLEAVELLWAIAASDLEHEAVRGQALLTLARISPAMAPVLLQMYLYHASPLLRQSAVSALAQTGSEAALAMLSEFLEREQDTGVQQHAAAAVRALGEQLGVRVPRAAAAARRPRAPLAPQSDE